MYHHPSQPIINGVRGENGLYQHKPSFSSNCTATIFSSSLPSNQLDMMINQKPIINPISSFDNLQSMSSVTTSSFGFSSNYNNSIQSNNQNMDYSGLQIIQTLREAEKRGYAADDVEVALQFNHTSPLGNIFCCLNSNCKNISFH